MPHVTEWFERCIGLPSFIRRLGYTRMTDKALKAFDPKAKPEALQEVKAAPAAKGGKGAKGGKKEKAAPAKQEKDDDVDMDDLFGDDGDDDGAAKAAAEKAKEAAKGKKKKAPVIAKSSVLFEVKPLDDQTNLDDLFVKI